MRLTVHSLVALALLAGAPLRAQQGPFTVGPVTARPGERASGFLEVPAAGDSGTRIPLTVVHGQEPGPVLALVGGTHGSEVAPILALHRVRRDLDPALLRGTVIIVHVANLPSFQKRTIYYSPIDGKNLNRVYPGKAGGTVSERIAHRITAEVIERADYLVDMHAGDGNEDLFPYSYWNKSGLDARTDSLGREMAVAWGNHGIVIDTARPRDPNASMYTQNTAHLRGKPAITTEGGYLSPPWSSATTTGSSACCATCGCGPAKRTRWIRRSGTAGPRCCRARRPGSGIRWWSAASSCPKVSSWATSRTISATDWPRCGRRSAG
jgi:hypothetical protein